MHSRSRQIGDLQRAFQIEFPESEAALIEAFQLRHQVYRVQRTFLAGEGSTESDEFDAVSRHILLRHVESRRVAGTARLVMPSPLGYPIDRVCAGIVHNPDAAELSRFSISKEFAGIEMLSLLLVRGLVQLARQHCVTQLVMLIDPGLRKLMCRASIYFDQIGPLVEHHGDRVPCSVSIAGMLKRLRQEQPAVWEFLTAY